MPTTKICVHLNTCTYKQCIILFLNRRDQHNSIYNVGGKYSVGKQNKAHNKTNLKQNQINLYNENVKINVRYTKLFIDSLTTCWSSDA